MCPHPTAAGVRVAHVCGGWAPPLPRQAFLLFAVEGHHQGALMAPTEVLAEQHAAEVRRLVDGLTVPDPTTLAGERPLRVALLTSRTGAADRIGRLTNSQSEAGHGALRMRQAQRQDKQDEQDEKLVSHGSL